MKPPSGLVFCSSCGASNPDDAAFCNKCGAALARPTAPPIPVPQVAPAESGLPPGGRNPWVAAILNLVIGIGYLYLGYRKVLGLPTILFVVVTLLVEVVLGFFTFGLLSLVAAIFLAYDGFVKAKGERGYLGTEPGIGYQP
jgi:zinc-ribbon domain